MIAPLAMAATILTASPAFAQDEEESSAIELSANVALVTDYRFRGVSFSDEDLAIQGGIDLSHESGFYIGTWASSLEEGAGPFGHTELDVYGGWAGDLAEGVSVDIGLLYYAYPNSTPGVDTEYFEPYASIGTALGPVEATFGVAYAWDQDSLGGDNTYIYGDLGTAVPDTPVSVTAHLGYSDGSLDYGSGGYLDWSVGADVSLDILTLGVAYIDTDLPSVAGQDSAVVFTLGASF
tara:strand:- start:1278 stop:1985 length:708 start_codon:yes stop_codon:yes gene_type:complete